MFKPLILLCGMVVLSAGFAHFAHGAKGVVVYYPIDCHYYIVESSRGYTLLEWYGGYDPNVGDTLAGDFESYGLKDIIDETIGTETKAYVEDFLLGQQSVFEKYKERCG